MILDERLEFADAASVAASAGTALIGDVIDLEAAGELAGNQSGLYLVIQTSTEIITGGSAGTIYFQLASDAQAAIATDASATIHATSATLTTDDSAANSDALNAGGTILVVELPRGATYERYLGILCTIGTTTVTAGNINAFLTRDPPSWAAMPNGI